MRIKKKYGFDQEFVNPDSPKSKHRNLITENRSILYSET